MEDESDDQMAFAPGIGAAINCFFPLYNTQAEDFETKQNNLGLHRSRDPGTGAFTQYDERVAYAVKDLKAGEELFTDYGEGYFTENPEQYGLIPLYDNYTQADKLLREYMQQLKETSHCNCENTTKSTTEESDTCNEKCNNTQMKTLHDEMYGLMKKLANVWPSRVLNALPEDPKVVEEIAEIGTEMVHYNRSIRDMNWLEENGLCMDNMVVKPSTIKQAGRGAFAKRFIPKGGLVGPTPLIHLEKSIVDMYPGDYYQADDGSLYYWVDREKGPMQKQLVLNYCYGHEESSVLLCPYGMHTSLINHNPDKSKVNAKLVWNHDLITHPEWLELAPKEWIKINHVGLFMDFVALRDLQPGEEVFIDYGDAWQQAWDNHVATWQPPPGAESYRPSFELNKDIDLVVRTEEENLRYSGSEVELRCLSFFTSLEGYDYDPEENPWTYNCRAMMKRENKRGEPRYVVEILERYDIEGERGSDSGYCYEELEGVLFDAPRDAFEFEDAPYSRDTAQPWGFRHAIGIPEEIMPEIWKDLSS